MRLLVSLIASAIINLSPLSARAAVSVSGVPLWKGFVSGMSEAQAQAVLPGGTNKHGQTLSDGSSERYEVESTLGVDKVGVTLKFRDTGLSDVLLSVRDVYTPAGGRIKLRELADQAKVKYGEPFSCADKSLPGVVSMGRYECSWRKGDLRLDMLYLDINGRDPVVTISYHADAKGLTNEF